MLGIEHEAPTLRDKLIKCQRSVISAPTTVFTGVADGVFGMKVGFVRGLEDLRIPSFLRFRTPGRFQSWISLVPI